MEVGFRKHFRKQFDKLPKKTQEFFYERLDIFLLDQFDPVLNNHRLHGKFKNLRSINITGDIRATYEQVDDNKVVFSMIASHSKLYDD